MAISLSLADIRKKAKSFDSLRARVDGMKRRGEAVMTKAVHSVESGAAAFTAGVVQGKTGGVDILGVPLELGLGVGLNLAGYLGLGGRMSAHLHGFGDGFLAAFLTTQGQIVGRKMAGTAPAAGAAGSGTGILESMRSVAQVGKGAAGFSDDELASTVIRATAREP